MHNPGTNLIFKVYLNSRQNAVKLDLLTLDKGG